MIEANDRIFRIAAGLIRIVQFERSGPTEATSETGIDANTDTERDVDAERDDVGSER